MCMGMMNYREPKESLNVISCKKCGKSWQVTESAAKHYNEYYKGVCADCRTGEEKKMSLLKRRTNFDNLKDLSAWNFAGKIDEFVQGDCDICPFSTMQGDVQECRLLDDRPTTCRRKYQQWLESEMPELKPCPFCGGEAIIYEIPPHTHHIAKFMPDFKGECFIECSKCSCMIGEDTKEKAIEVWNRRTNNATD